MENPQTSLSRINASIAAQSPAVALTVHVVDPVPAFDVDGYFVFATRQGLIKRTPRGRVATDTGKQNPSIVGRAGSRRDE